MKRIHFIFYAFTALFLLGGCATKPQSDVDTPEYHFRAGMRAVDSGIMMQRLIHFSGHWT